MNQTESNVNKKIKRRSFFYYIGSAAIGSLIFSRFPFKYLKSTGITKTHSSIKVTGNPFAVKRTDTPGQRGKGPVNG